MTDLDIAKTELYEENLTLAIVKNGELLYATKSHRISGFLDAIDKCQNRLESASLADRVAGKALALLCAHAKIRHVYAALISRKAQAVFKTYGITVQWHDVVDNILDSSKTGMCPFEKAAAEISDPEKAYRTFRELLRNMKACK